jgi:hypothetical protein
MVQLTEQHSAVAAVAAVALMVLQVHLSVSKQKLASRHSSSAAANHGPWTV